MQPCVITQQTVGSSKSTVSSQSIMMLLYGGRGEKDAHFLAQERIKWRHFGRMASWRSLEERAVSA